MRPAPCPPRPSNARRPVFSAYFNPFASCSRTDAELAGPCHLLSDRRPPCDPAMPVPRAPRSGPICAQSPAPFAAPLLSHAPHSQSPAAPAVAARSRPATGAGVRPNFSRPTPVTNAKKPPARRARGGEPRPIPDQAASRGSSSGVNAPAGAVGSGSSGRSADAADAAAAASAALRTVPTPPRAV